MKVRPAKKSDIPEILGIVSAVRKEYFEKNGIPQWNDGYPDRAIFEEDLENGGLFVLSQGENVIGTVTVTYARESRYDAIEGEGWQEDGDYAVVHRIAVSPDFHGMGLGGALIAVADKLCEQRGLHSVRSDTHEANIGMRRTLEKAGYTCRGTIHNSDGAARLAYEKLL